MNNNTIWNKAAVEVVASNLSNNHLIELNGMIFIRPDSKSRDPGHSQLNGIVEATCGASVVRLHVGPLKEMQARNPDGFADELLRMAKPEGNDLYAVLLHQEVFKPEHADKLLFMIAHELGHIHYGHHLGAEMTDHLTTENEADEILADTFACELLGSNTPAIETFEMLIEKVEEVMAEVNIQEDLEMLTAVKTHCYTRMKSVQNAF